MSFLKYFCKQSTITLIFFEIDFHPIIVVSCRYIDHGRNRLCNLCVFIKPNQNMTSLCVISHHC